MTLPRLSLLAIAGVAAACVVSPATAKPKRPPMHFASPAGIVAAEVERSQLARSKGQWTAWRATAADDAVLFVPQPVVARDWLKRQQGPAPAEARQPHQVWLSCDGSLAVTYGAVQQADGSPGFFTTVWQRQKDGKYKWVMDGSEPLATPLAAPEMIGASVAKCDRTRGFAPPTGPDRKTGKGPPAASPAPPLPAGTQGGWSEDRSLSWMVQADRDCARALRVTLSAGVGEARQTVLEKRIAAPPPGSSLGQGCPS